MSNKVAKLVGTLFVASFASLPALATPPGQLAIPPPGQLALPGLESLEPQARDSVSISLDASLLAAAARFLDSAQPEDRTVKEIITGLQGVYVRSYTFDHAFVYPASAMESMRKQLHAACWQSIVSVHKSQEQSGVDIFVCQLQQRTRGLAIIAIEPRELTIVNIVGAIDLEKLHRLEGHFGIPRLPAGK
jgi:hypothetical protein